MGWFGVVFKGEIMRVSNELGIGLSTGFLGSLTTFSGWNQKTLDLSVNGHWVFALLAIFIGNISTTNNPFPPSLLVYIFTQII